MGLKNQPTIQFNNYGSGCWGRLALHQCEVAFAKRSGRALQERSASEKARPWHGLGLIFQLAEAAFTLALAIFAHGA